MPTQLPQNRILLVDDDARFLSLITELMQDYSAGGWHVQSATDSAMALALLQAETIDLVVLDVHMPVVDGVQFLRLLQRRFPSLAKVVLTGDATGAHRRPCLDCGADLYFEKPRTSEGWNSVFATLEQLTRLHTADSGFRGMLRQVNLQDILQMECLSRSSTVLDVSDGQVRGKIFIEDGSFIHAEVGEQTGETALNTLLALKHGEFSLHAFIEPAQRSISGPWEFLLMEAARQRDENAGAIDPTSSGGLALAEPPLEPSALSVGAAPPLPAILADPGEGGSEMKPRLDEVILCSTRGEIWHEWQSRRPESRIQLMTLLRHKASQLGEGLPLGRAEQFQVENGLGRFLIRFKPHACLLVRLTLIPNGAPAHEG